MSTDLVRRQRIAEKVAAWDESVADIREALRLFDVAEKRLEEAFGGAGHYFSLREHVRRYSDDALIAKFQLNAWSGLFSALEVRQFLSVEAAAQLDRQLDGRGDDFGPITIDNVMAVMKGLHQAIPKLAEDAVREVYEFLRPWNSSKKTNSLWRVGKKVILEGACEAKHPNWGWRPRVQWGRHSDQLRALDRVFHLLDGRGYVSKTHGGELIDAIQADGGTEQGETTYFRFRCYRNGNLHVEFKRADLVQQLNAVAGGKRLRPETDSRAA